MPVVAVDALALHRSQDLIGLPVVAVDVLALHRLALGVARIELEHAQFLERRLLLLPCNSASRVRVWGLGSGVED